MMEEIVEGKNRGDAEGAENDAEGVVENARLHRSPRSSYSHHPPPPFSNQLH